MSSKPATQTTSITESITRRGGLAATFELHRDGYTRLDLTHAVSYGQIIRVRQGWYANPGTHPKLLEAARVGGRLSCLSGIGLHGIWQYPTPKLHVCVPPTACRLRNPHRMKLRLEHPDPRVRVHWGDRANRDGKDGANRLLLDPLRCLADVILCQNADVVVATADSALFNGVITRSDWRELLGRMPARTLGLDQVEPRCESGIESLTRFRLLPFQLDPRPQVWIPGVGRVDFLIGRSLVIELDGETYHVSSDQFRNDRHRDAVLSQFGYRVLRFSYEQVVYAWPEVEAAILAAVVRGDHH